MNKTLLRHASVALAGGILLICAIHGPRDLAPRRVPIRGHWTPKLESAPSRPTGSVADAQGSAQEAHPIVASPLGDAPRIDTTTPSTAKVRPLRGAADLDDVQAREVEEVLSRMASEIHDLSAPAQPWSDPLCVQTRIQEVRRSALDELTRIVGPHHSDSLQALWSQISVSCEQPGP